MPETKALPLNLVAGDKGKKSENVGIAFWNTDGKVPLSIVLSMTVVEKLMKNRDLTSRKEEPSKNQYPNPFEGHDTIRIVGFKKTKKTA